MELINNATDDMANQIQIPPGTPFDKKWDLLKPIIRRMYLDEDHKLSEVMAMLKVRYDFNAE